MHIFPHLVQSLLTVCALVSEYTLVFDRWVITSPAGPVVERRHIPKSEIRRKRWISAFRTSMAYALFEPACCWLILKIPMDVGWWFMMAGVIQIGTNYLAFKVKAESLDEVAKEHHRLCGGPAVEEEEEALPNEDGEKEDETLLGRGTHDNDEPASPAAGGTAAPPTPCVKKHDLGRAYQLITYSAVFGAALSNAGIILYCRYLNTADSHVWLDKFAVGWTTVALTGGFCFLAGKYTNRSMHSCCFRPRIPSLTAWDAGQILSCLAIVLVVRTASRSLLAQSPFIPVVWSEAQSALVVEGYPMPRNMTTNADGSERKPDPVWAKVGLVANVLNFVGWGGYWVYVRVKRHRRRRAERVIK